MDLLEQRKYRVAPITVDYKDYMFARAYARNLRAGNTEMAEKIRQAYLNQVDIGSESAEKSSREIFGYELPQILLVHCSEMNSVSLRDSIARMRARGYSFITLQEAMSDPAYQRPDTFVSRGDSWLERSARALNKPFPQRNWCPSGSASVRNSSEVRCEKASRSVARGPRHHLGRTSRRIRTLPGRPPTGNDFQADADTAGREQPQPGRAGCAHELGDGPVVHLSEI
jgi:hypothetical protein